MPAEPPDLFCLWASRYFLFLKGRDGFGHFLGLWPFASFSLPPREVFGARCNPPGSGSGFFLDLSIGLSLKIKLPDLFFQ